MKYLLDTHSLLWFIDDNAQLSVHARRTMEDDKNELFISIASLWEIAIKISIGKLILDQPYDQMFPQQLVKNRIELLDINLDHLRALLNLPFHHRDPFDRLIIAQAMTDDLPIIGIDLILDDYGVKRVW